MSVNRFGDFLKGNPDAVGADGYRESYAQVNVFDVDGWSVRYIGKGIYELRPVGDYPGKIAQTGLATTSDCKVPIAHRLVKYEWKHLTSALADGTDACAAYLSRDDWIPLGGLYWRLYYEAATTASTTVVPFGEGYEYRECTYRVGFTTTNTDWCLPVIWVQAIKP